MRQQAKLTTPAQRSKMQIAKKTFKNENCNLNKNCNLTRGPRRCFLKQWCDRHPLNFVGSAPCILCARVSLVVLVETQNAKWAALKLWIFGVHVGRLIWNEDSGTEKTLGCTAVDGIHFLHPIGLWWAVHAFAVVHTRHNCKQSCRRRWRLLRGDPDAAARHKLTASTIGHAKKQVETKKAKHTPERRTCTKKFGKFARPANVEAVGIIQWSARNEIEKT
eukprot:GHVT01062576.1.p2 GENE.GHVT01062576.1~~GHVT01062576.1.p2  ORF type:complete len:220 (-),score=10.22 GHVT01062576.1:4267-4926(-)